MKLILFLAAIYALIFHQYYKIEKYRIFPSPAKEVIRSRDLVSPATLQPRNSRKADDIARMQYLPYRNSVEFAVAKSSW